MANFLRKILCSALFLHISFSFVYAADWQELTQKLARDGLSGQPYQELLSLLPATPTQSPMGRKIFDLYQRKFYPKQVVEREFYPGVVTDENAKTCLAYMRKHAQWFDLAQNKYGVPPSIAVALLFVETRLGTVLADVPENAFYTLASMAVTRKFSDIPLWTPKLKEGRKRVEWIEQKMRERADWAYREFRALLVYMVDNKLKPNEVPGSIYGAVGLCQFMPSNIAVYAEDGNKDGRIDLFMIEDASLSLAKYLAKHGWKSDLCREEQHKILMRYNHAKVYANTILALSDLILIQASNQPKKAR
ncbi:MAG: lytic murein transglycosylase [Desulfovibrio sp.]|nr:lytic murein transglycosylase [Desulfovibrio sp.]